MSQRVLVCGGRDFNDMGSLCGVLDKFHEKDELHLLIHGCAPGADSLAGVEKSGVPWFRRNSMFRAVRWFGPRW